MKRNLLTIFFMSMLLNIGYTQCGVTGMQTQILQDSSFPILNTSTSTVVVRIVNGNYPTTIGVEDSTPGVGNADVLSSNETGNIVANAATVLGVYEVEINNPGTGCIDTFEVEVVLTLPVEWLEPLSAKEKDNSVEVSFSTAQQINNSHFVVERSINGNDFEAIEIIEGEGNATTENYYYFLDKKPSIGTNYYRVKQVDFDGKYDYSNIASIRFKDNETSIFPNPSTGIISVISNQNRAIKILNQLGRTVKKVLIEKGENTIDISELSNGVYFLQIGDKTETIIIE